MKRRKLGLGFEINNQGYKYCTLSYSSGAFYINTTGTFLYTEVDFNLYLSELNEIGEVLKSAKELYGC